MLRVYIAGPVHGSSTQANNISVAIEAADAVARCGFLPFVPHLYFQWESQMRRTDQEFWMRQCLGWLESCDCVLRLEGSSPGAEREVEHAQRLGLPVYGIAEAGWATALSAMVHDYKCAPRLLHARNKPESGIDMRLFQAQVTKWLERQPFGEHDFTNRHRPLLGITEEVGELSHAHLKAEQDIRGGKAAYRDKAMDAIGDILVYMAGYCRANGLDMSDCAGRAWSEVSKRDWRMFPNNGISE